MREVHEERLPAGAFNRLVGSALSVVTLCGALIGGLWYVAGLDGRERDNQAAVESLNAEQLPKRMQAIEDKEAGQRDDITSLRASLHELGQNIESDHALLAGISAKLDLMISQPWNTRGAGLK